LGRHGELQLLSASAAGLTPCTSALYFTNVFRNEIGQGMTQRPAVLLRSIRARVTLMACNESDKGCWQLHGVGIRRQRNG